MKLNKEIIIDYLLSNSKENDFRIISKNKIKTTRKNLIYTLRNLANKLEKNKNNDDEIVIEL